MRRKRNVTSRRTQVRRTRVLTAGIAFLATAFAARAAQLQIVEGERWRVRAEDQTTARVEIPAMRGVIYDRNGAPLVFSRPEYRAFFAPAEAADRARDAETVASVLGLGSRDRRRLAGARSGWVPIGRVDGREREALEDAVPRGVHFQSIEARVHPEGTLARALLGTVGPDGRGISGVELALDSLLRGQPGEAFRRRAAVGAEYPLSDAAGVPPRPGHDVYLTLDAELQAIAEQALSRAIEDTGASGGDILMLDPRTGELLAVASRREGAAASIPALSDPYEPGSTVKPFLLATLLQEKLARLDERIATEHGEYRTPYRTIRDVHPYDTLTVAEVVRYSSNIGAAKLAERLEPGVQYRYLRDFGFGTPTGVGLPGESGGLLRRPAAWSALTQASLSFGYELMVTSLQLAAAYGALANGGVLMQPAIVREIRDAEGNVVWHDDPQPLRRVVDRDVAARVGDVLASVVEDGGTGEGAALATLRVAGKTGTARIATVGGYTQRRYAASFVGYLPAQDPRLVILAKLEDPKASVYGGRTAAPVSRAVVQAIVASASLGLVEPAAASRVSRGTVKWGQPGREEEGGGSGRSPYVLAASSSGSHSPPREADVATVRLPDVVGLDLRTAVSRLHGLGLHVELRGSGRVRRQVPRPGKEIVRGATVVLE